MGDCHYPRGVGDCHYPRGVGGCHYPRGVGDCHYPRGAGGCHYPVKKACAIVSKNVYSTVRNEKILILNYCKMHNLNLPLFCFF